MSNTATKTHKIKIALRCLVAVGALSVAFASPSFAWDRDNNPPGRIGGPGTNWENPPGPIGGPGTSPDRRRWRRFDRDNNPPGRIGGPGTNWENPPGPIGGPGTSPDRRWGWKTRYYNPPGPVGGPGAGPFWH